MESLADEDGLDVSFNFLGVNYTENNDLEFPNFPVIQFNEGVFEGLNFLVEDRFAIGAVTFDQFSYAGGNGNVTYLKREEPHASVPEPGTPLGLSILGLGWLLLKARSRRVAEG